MAMDDHLVIAEPFPDGVLVHAPPDQHGLIAGGAKDPWKGGGGIPFLSLLIADEAVGMGELAGEKGAAGGDA